MTNFEKNFHQDMISQLHNSAAAGDAVKLKALLGHSPSLINAPSDNGWTALMYGARNGHLEVVQILLEEGPTQMLCSLLDLRMKRQMNHCLVL